MLWSVPFALLLIAVVILKYLRRPHAVCPQCGSRRDEDAPLCGECGWIFAVPGEDEDDEDDDGPEDYEIDDEAWRR